MVRAYDDEIKEPSPLQELFTWNIDKQISNLQEALQNIIDEALHNATSAITNEDVNRVATAYNLLVSYIQTFAKSHTMNQRDKGALDKKFLELEPLFQQIRQIINYGGDYNVEINANNIHIIDYIEQQVKDSNYRGLNLVDYRRIPVVQQWRRAQAERAVVAPSPPRPAFAPSTFIKDLASRAGTPYSDTASSYRTPQKGEAVEEEEAFPLYPTPNPKRPVVELDDEDVSSVPIFGQAEGLEYLASPQKPKTPRKLPTPPQVKQPNVLFSKKPKGFATINGARILDNTGQLISQLTWVSLSPQEQQRFIRQALNEGSSAEGSGSKGKGNRYISKTAPAPYLYDPDDNNLWANYK